MNTKAKGKDYYVHQRGYFSLPVSRIMEKNTGLIFMKLGVGA